MQSQKLPDGPQATVTQKISKKYVHSFSSHSAHNKQTDVNAQPSWWMQLQRPCCNTEAHVTTYTVSVPYATYVPTIFYLQLTTINK